MQFDYVIVGAGLFGAVFAQQMREHGRSVLVLEKRDHIGGNCFSFEYEDTGIHVHRYGTHIFHTDNDRIWEYVNRFTAFNRYQHRVLTTSRGRVYSMPINLGTINAYFGLSLTPQEAGPFLAAKREAIAEPRNLEEKAVSLIGRELYEAFIRGYTAKQWGCDPRDLPASIITRLPVRTSFHDSYFDDRYQGIPAEGYTRMFDRMLEGIPVELGVDFLADADYWRRKAGTVIFTGPLDAYFGHALGRLRWRSVRFETERLGIEDFQGTSVMNFADADIPHTRIHEPKHLHREHRHAPDTTVVVREYPCMDDQRPYYPVNSAADEGLLERYRELARGEARTIFGGRLAEYRYYDMHQVIGAALQRAKKALSESGRA